MRSWADIRQTLVTCALVLVADPSFADEIAVDVVNASEPTLCAETDNVYLKLVSGEARGLTIEAVHPAYAGTITVDNAAADFRNCDMAPDHESGAGPRRVTLWETEEWQLVGHTFATFWRPSAVPVRVDDRVETGLHLIQLWHRFRERAEEVLVLYPTDGYWRARPLPPAHLRWTAYGSSFLVGPVETAGRPFVDITEVRFDPARRSFGLTFARGGAATLRLKEIDQEHIVLDVALDQPVAADRPFAGLRSMYVTQANADVAQVAWRGTDGRAWHEAP
ncbi:MAG: hypothetical protein ABSG76_20790, partial [Xanthobacteraceae bacterium]